MPIPKTDKLSKKRKHSEILTETQEATSQSKGHDFFCNICGGKYIEPISEDWVQCSVCSMCHGRCYDKDTKHPNYLCDICALVV